MKRANKVILGGCLVLSIAGCSGKTETSLISSVQSSVGTSSQEKTSLISSISPSSAFAESLDAPFGIAATFLSERNSVTLAWSTEYASSIDGMEIEFYGESSEIALKAFVNLNGGIVEGSSALKEGTYFFRVRAVKGEEVSPWCETDEDGKSLQLVIEGKTPISAPLGLVVDDTDEGWLVKFAPVSDAVQYKLYICRGDEVVVEERFDASYASTGYAYDSSVLESGEYDVYLSAIDAEGNESSRSSGCRKKIASRVPTPEFLSAEFAEETRILSVTWEENSALEAVKVKLLNPEGEEEYSSDVEGNHRVDLAESDLNSGTFVSGRYVLLLVGVQDGLLSEEVRKSIYIQGSGPIAEEDLPIIWGNDDLPIKIEGAGVWIYLDNSGLGITEDTSSSFDVEIDFEGVADEDSLFKDYATGGIHAITVSDYRFDDFRAEGNTVRLYVLLSAGLRDENAYTHHFTITLNSGEKIYRAELSFYNNAVVGQPSV